MSDARADRLQPWIGRVVAVMAIAIAMYLGLTIWTGLDRLGDTLSAFPWATDLGTILGLVLVVWSIRALRWHYYTRYLGWQIPFLPNTLAFLASFAFTATPGKAGEVVKAGLLRRRYGVAISDTVGVLLAERLGDLLAVLLLAAGGLTILADTRLYYSICLVGVGAITLLVRSERIHRAVFLWLGRLPRMGALPIRPCSFSRPAAGC